MISTQVPPDLVLYSGARDSSRPGAAPPKGVITPGAVRFFPFTHVSGFFIDSKISNAHVAVARRELKSGESFDTAIGEDGEQLLFVWSGAIAVSGKGFEKTVPEKDTVFITGPNRVMVRNKSSISAVVIEVQSPPFH